MSQYSVPKKKHRENQWFVQQLAYDFELLDVWEYPIIFRESEGDSFHLFQKHAIEPTLQNAFDISAAGMLFHLRALYGYVFRVDTAVNNVPVPECTEVSLQERMSEEDMKRHLPEKAMQLRTENFLDFRNVYTFENESVHEIANSTEHTLMHYSWNKVGEDQYKVQMAAYVKHRNWMGTGYVKLIGPFRHRIVYPHLFDKYVRLWNEFKAKNSNVSEPSAIEMKA